MTTEYPTAAATGTTAARVTSRRLRGRNDPERPRRIAQAAITVIAERGIEALTHRAVAAAAGVPLGSTTYYFASLDELIAAALDEAAARSVAALREWDRRLSPDADLATELTNYVVEALTEHRADTLAEYNLYAIAMHRSNLRAAAADWDRALEELYVARTDPLTGRLIATLTCGLLMQSVLSDDTPTRCGIRALFVRALAGSPHANRLSADPETLV